jgi:hypothetical protein
MKLLPVSVALLGTLSPLSAVKPALEWDVEIPEAIADGRQSVPAVKAEPIDFKVLHSRSMPIEVSESPEMSDLPPITGTINVTVQVVDDPKLPDPPPLPVLPPDDPAVIARIGELREKYQSSEILFISATIYDNKRTLLRIYPNGEMDKEITAWSNLNFNHFSGCSSYRVKGADGTFHDCSLLMGIGNADTGRIEERAIRTGDDYEQPQIPNLPDLKAGGPAFVVMEGDTDSAAMDTLEQVHDLYRKEGTRMEAAFHSREKSHAERKASLLANPPVPKDVTIRFWNRK